MRTTRSILTMTALLGALASACAAQTPRLRVYVPRAIVVGSATLRLDAICVVRGADDEIAKAAGAVTLGRSPLCGEQIVIDRKTILSRLAASGIASGDVEFTGTEQVAVTRREKAVDAEKLARSAEAFLNRSRPAPAGAVYRLAETPKGLSVDDPGEEIELRPRLAKELPAGGAVVEVVLLAGGQELARRELSFRLGYTRKELVATKDIPAGGTLSPENAEVRIVPADQPTLDEPPRWGAVLAAPVRAGGIVAPSLLRPAGGPSALKRGQAVVMKIQTPKFTISSVGLALQDGRAGELIKVQNADTRRTVTARVESDGTVTPVYEEKQ